MKVKTKDIKANPNNPRVIKDDQFKKLVKSIQEFPEMLSVRKLVCTPEMIVLGGNMRLKALQSAGIKEIDVEIVDWNEEKQKEFIIKDNVSFGEWNHEQLANEWDTIELSEWGLELPVNVDDTELEAYEDDYEAPSEIKTDIVIGDLIEIGEHRLLCGDSTCSDAVAKLMNGEKADMVFTDPPYGVSYQSNYRTKTEKFDVLQNDDIIDCDFLPIIPVNKNVAFYIWTRWDVYAKWIDLVSQSYKVTSCIVWAKQAGGLGDLESFWNQHEFAIYAVNGRVKLRGKRQGNLWQTEDHRSKDYVHPTQKPVELPARAIEATSDVGNLIVDVFLGSGSTMVASHQLKRKCYGMELDPKYCQVIIDRMQKLDPTLEVRLNGKEYKI